NKQVNRTLQNRRLGKNRKNPLKEENYLKEKINENINIMVDTAFNNLKMISNFVEKEYNYHTETSYCDGFYEKVTEDETAYKTLLENTLFDGKLGKLLLKYAEKYPAIMLGMKFSQDFIGSLFFDDIRPEGEIKIIDQNDEKPKVIEKKQNKDKNDEKPYSWGKIKEKILF
ncbi:MAG: hypothetical protein ACTSRG_22945, partial [Candidatus Helarchaeota archaeon]